MCLCASGGANSKVSASDPAPVVVENICFSMQRPLLCDIQRDTDDALRGCGVDPPPPFVSPSSSCWVDGDAVALAPQSAVALGGDLDAASDSGLQDFAVGWRELPPSDDTAPPCLPMLICLSHVSIL